MGAVTVVVPGAGHVLPQRLGQELEVLEHHREQAHVVAVVVFADVDAVQQDVALLGVIQAAQQLDEGGLAAAVFAHHRHPPADAELDVHVPQGPGAAAGVSEGDVLKLHLVLPVGALLGGQAALVHLVGDVEELVDVPHEGDVAPKHAQSLDQNAHVFGQGADRAHILGDAADPESPGPRLDADKQIDQPGEDGAGAGAQRRPDTDGAAAGAGQGRSAVVKDAFRFHVMAGDLLLVVHTDVHAPAFVIGQETKTMKHPVAEAGVLGTAGQMVHGAVVAQGAQRGGEGQGQHQQSEEGGAVQNGERPGRSGHRQGKEADGEHRRAQNACQPLGHLFKLVPEAVEAEPGPVLALGNLRAQVVGLGLVDVGKVHRHHLVGKHPVFTLQELGFLGCFPAQQRAGHKSQGGGAGHSQHGQGPQHPGAACAGQLVDDPGRQIDRYIRAEGGGRPIQDADSEGPGAVAAHVLEGAPMDLKCLAHGDLIRFGCHPDPSLPGSSGPAPQTVWRRRRPCAEVPRGCLPRRCPRP